MREAHAQGPQGHAGLTAARPRLPSRKAAPLPAPGAHNAADHLLARELAMSTK
ncbi:hypothetical protein [Paenibacillus sp. YPG26]|uniref:hypothetical protein n=1 Tax=Paenibacillus sp. YPG26 TaxID=2878915 RepID=UPI00203E2E9D|nr:hypothetical protein [Paenibacillus sp. YPG26]USB33572.1 hypothetical protein LDO05_01720 [Paenibacillus sp. YPG26]